MPRTLYRYILRDLLKLLGLTTAVLVVVMSFAAAFQPMSEGLLTPGLLLKFVAFTAPTVLGLALPFAGAFASTLTFLRLSNDNEITACSASGLSYARLLLPVAVLGVGLTVGLLVLSDRVVPHFFRQAARAATRDVVGVMAGQLATNEAFVADGFRPGARDSFVIYADATRQLPTRAASVRDGYTLVQRVELEGVAVGEIGPDQQIVNDATARRAELLVVEEAATGDTAIKLNLEDVVRSDIGYVARAGLKWIRLPSTFSEDPKFFSGPELSALAAAPEGFDDVRKAMDRLAAALATESVRNALAVTRQRAVLNGVLGSRYLLNAPGVAGPAADPANGTSAGGDDAPAGGLRLLGPVRVAYYPDGDTAGTPQRTYLAERAAVDVFTSRFDPEPSIDLRLSEVTVDGPPDDPAPAVQEDTLTLAGLNWPTRILSEDLANQTAAQLRDRSRESTFATAPAVVDAAGGLDRATAGLRRSITAERNRRASSAVSCALLLVLGALLSMRLKGEPPLTVYFWSFLLAIVTLIVVNTGVNLATSRGGVPAVGLMVMWSGNAVLAGVIVALYLKVVRH